jgi:phosphoenolpyruvate-protein phosphotransferase (PTS system enzyme I)
VPMVAHVSEIKLVFEAIARAKQQLLEAAKPFTDVAVGAMIEVPAAALILPSVLRRFDFVSIGTNDLIQYTLAIDRADEAVAHLYDPWHPAVLQLVWQTIDQAHKAGRHVSVCGEMAGDPAFTPLLLAMGLRSFSMHPSQISSIKQRVLRGDTTRLAAQLDAVLCSEDPQAACASWERQVFVRPTQAETAA